MVEIRRRARRRLAPADRRAVLKYAQALYGVDHAAVEAIGGVEPSTLPSVGEMLHLRHHRGVAARNLLFLGVEDLSRLDYQSVRLFGFTAVSRAAEACPTAREICLTLHGTGIGLDETEVFDAEVAGRRKPSIVAWRASDSSTS